MQKIGSLIASIAVILVAIWLVRRAGNALRRDLGKK